MQEGGKHKSKWTGYLKILKQVDQEGDRKYGKKNRGDKLPKKLLSKKLRLKLIKEAYKKLKTST
jgi:hypothetical protein